MSEHNLGGRVLVLYWGRRGAGSKILADMIQAAGASERDDIWFSFSSDNELVSKLRAAAPDALVVPTFKRAWHLVLTPFRLPHVIWALFRYCRAREIDSVVNLMPHIWTGIVAALARLAGLRWGCIVHDVNAHPGDRTGCINRVLRLEARFADRRIALSEHVRQSLETATGVSASTIQLYALHYPRTPETRVPGPLRFLFFGRMMRYKGLDTLVHACEILIAEGRKFELSVVGEGPLGETEQRLRRIGAQIDNRWVDHDEVQALFSRHDVVVVPSREASQSGVVATAHGCGLPVIVTAVGGLVEQVRPGVDGLVCSGAGPAAVAAAMRCMLDDSDLLDKTRRGALSTATDRGPEQFLNDVLHEMLPHSLASRPKEIAGSHA